MYLPKSRSFAPAGTDLAVKLLNLLNLPLPTPPAEFPGGGAAQNIKAVLLDWQLAPPW